MTNNKAQRDNDLRTLYTTSGKTYQLEPVSDLLPEMAKKGVEKRYRERGEPIDPPTYTVTTAGGGTEEHAHDETTLETDDDKKAWLAHKDALIRMRSEQNEMEMKAWLTGIVFDLPEDTSWITRQRYLGVEVPEEPQDLRWHYLTTEVLRTPDDYFQATAKITKLSYAGAVPEEAVDAAMSTFRGAVQEKAPGGNRDKAGTVDTQPKAQRSRRRRKNGDATKPVQADEPGG